jgi:hypothetical protein
MKLTTSGISDKDDFETECEPELPKGQKIIEDEQVSNVIIFKPIEHEKMKNMK